MANQRKPDPIDIHVGSRVKLHRRMLGISQEKHGDSLGITFQQVQKYEKGTNRISASPLQHIAAILSVPVSSFFEDAPGTPSDAADETQPAIPLLVSSPALKVFSSTRLSSGSRTTISGDVSRQGYGWRGRQRLNTIDGR